MKRIKAKRIMAAFLTGMLTVGLFGQSTLPIRAASNVIESRTVDISDIGSRIPEMFDRKEDNTWLFAGGIETQGRYTEVAGRRNYVGQFQECIRRTDGSLAHNGEDPVNQRYIFNVGQAGWDISDFLFKLDDYILDLDPRGVDYLIGEEDYSKGADGIKIFQWDLSAFIETALAMKDGEGFVVIQLAHATKDASQMENIQLYNEAAKEVLADFSQEDLERVVFVDHFTQTNTNAFLNGDNFTKDGKLNAKGHLEVGRQLCVATINDLRYFVNSNSITIWEEEEGPQTYLPLRPEVTASADCLNVSIPKEAEFLEGCIWRLQIDDMTIEGEADSDVFTLKNLPENKTYKLTILSSDGSTQLKSAYGTIQEGETAGERSLNELQQQIADRVKDEADHMAVYGGFHHTRIAVYIWLRCDCTEL